MHDIKWIREQPEAFDSAMVRRGLSPLSQEILALDKAQRGAIQDEQKLQEEANRLAKEIGQCKAKGEDAEEVIARSKEVKQQLAAAKQQGEGGNKGDAGAVQEKLAGLPNILDEEVPEGDDEEANHSIRTWGEPEAFSFTPKEHYELGEAMGLMDFEQTAKISGARFVTLKGALAKLERALANFMLDMMTQEYGYQEMSVPLLVRSDAMVGTGQLPKFGEDAFQTTDGKWLISTSEISLANQVREQILDEEALPIRMAAHTPCFRSEAGSAGRDTAGMIRQHQFSKVEQVVICTPEQEVDEHERITQAAEAVLQRLELPYRVMLLCSGDTGFSARKTYDLEVWLPGQGKYREISSCSMCGDFQARRMKARYRKTADRQTHFVHTLNGSGLAVGRTLVAVLENYQQADGSIHVPIALRPYMAGVEVIA